MLLLQYGIPSQDMAHHTYQLFPFSDSRIDTERTGNSLTLCYQSQYDHHKYVNLMQQMNHDNPNGKIEVIVIGIRLSRYTCLQLLDCVTNTASFTNTAPVDQKILFVMVAVADGTVHPLTATTLSFLKRLFIYRSALHILFQDTSSPTSNRQDTTSHQSACVLRVSTDVTCWLLNSLNKQPRPVPVALPPSTSTDAAV